MRTLFEELAAAAWLVVRTYPCERRGQRVAANLLHDVEYQVCVRPFRLRAGSEIPMADDLGDMLDRRAAGLDGRPDERDAHPGDELAELLAGGARAGLAEADLDLLRALYLESDAGAVGRGAVVGLTANGPQPAPRRHRQAARSGGMSGPRRLDGADPQATYTVAARTSSLRTNTTLAEGSASPQGSAASARSYRSNSWRTPARLPWLAWARSRRQTRSS